MSKIIGLDHGHRLVEIRIERLAAGVDLPDAVLLEHAHQLAPGQLHAIGQRLAALTGLGRGLQAEFEAVANGEQVTDELLVGELERVLRVALEPAAGVLQLRHRAQLCLAGGLGLVFEGFDARLQRFGRRALAAFRCGVGRRGVGRLRDIVHAVAVGG